MILGKIKETLPRMSPNFRKIASFILDNDNNVAFTSIYSLSEALDISTATLVRFAKSLGYKGYQSFKKDLQEEIQHRLQPYDKVSLSKLGTLPEEKRLQKLIQNEYNNLRSTLNNLQLKDFETMIGAVQSARRIFIAGFGITRHFAQILQTTFLASQGKDVFVITGSVSDYSPQLKSFGAGDIMFLMTFPPYSAEVKHVASVAKERGGFLCLFTDSASCPVYSKADVVIKCTTNSLLMSNSFVGLVSVIHVFIHMLLLSSENGGKNIRNGLEMEKMGYSIIADAGEQSCS
ncbi:MAG: MurR/RpiR family transcriptional regulator [Rectinema subterraneum]